MKNNFLLIILAIIATISACNSNKKSDQNLEAKPDSSQTSIDWPGVYRGVLPCADCEGIETEIVINADLTYQIAEKYAEKSEETIRENGNFIWDESGSKIIFINTDSKKAANQYLVGENMLFKLDENGNRIEGELKEKYQLKKVQLNKEISEKYWKLIELNGKEVILGRNQDTAPHLALKNENSRVFGNGGCNAFQGTYELSAGNKIKFSEMASTKMFCDFMEMETALLKALEMTDNFSVEKDTVSLNNASKVSVAKFQMIYGK